jgi:acid phosphatase family membrane protein YuiD
MSAYILIPLAAWALAQLIKLLIDSVTRRRLDLSRLAAMGGMPSSHTALVASLTTVVGTKVGVQSPLFAICAIFSAVVMYDATGIRRAAGQQAHVLNRILDDVFHQHGIREERLRELIGHTPVEVLVGGILGVVVAILLLHR